MQDRHPQSSPPPSPSQPERLLAEYDRRYAQAQQKRQDDKISRRAYALSQRNSRSVDRWSLQAMVHRWNAALAPYASRLMWVIVPIGLSGTVKSWPRRAHRYAIVLSVQPQGWPSKERRYWLAWWTHWALGHPDAPHEHWFDFHHKQEHTLWTRIFYMIPDASCESGWAWESRNTFPAIAPHVDAANTQPLVANLQNTIEQAMKSIDSAKPVELAGRWHRGPWHRAVQEESAEESFHWRRLWRSTDTWMVFIGLLVLFIQFPQTIPGDRSWFFAGALTFLYDRSRMIAWKRWFAHFQ